MARKVRNPKKSRGPGGLPSAAVLAFAANVTYFLVALLKTFARLFKAECLMIDIIAYRAAAHSIHQYPAVDGECVAGDEGRRVAGKIEHSMGDIFRFAEAL